MFTPMEPTTPNTARLSGGETEDRPEFLKLRALIQQEEDVLEVLALSWVPMEQRWLYLIKTPFATWPKYVVGFTDAANADPEILLRCGHESSARDCFNEQNQGDHP